MLKQKFLLVVLHLLLHQLNLTTLSKAFILEGSQTSYAQFRKWHSSSSASLEFEFWTSQPYGLMLYTDDGGYYDFLEVKLVDASLRIRLNLGNGAQIADLGQDLNSSTWHKVKIERNGTQTIIELDGKIRAVLPDSSKIRPTINNNNKNNNNRHHRQNLNKYHDANSRAPLSAVEFGGNFSANSFVYVGGLPSFYSTKLSSLALPSAVFEPRFRGSIRNIVYADDESGRPRRQEVMAYKVSSPSFRSGLYIFFIFLCKNLSLPTARKKSSLMFRSHLELESER